MKIEKPIQLSAEETTSRMKALTTYWDNKYGTRTSWDNNKAQITGKVKGISFNGMFTIEEGRLLADVNVGMLAEKLGGRTYVESKLAEYLNPNTPISALATS